MQIKRSKEGLLEKIDILANNLEIDMLSVSELNAYFKECGDVIRSLLKELEPYKAIGTVEEFKNLKYPDLILCKDGTYAHEGDIVSVKSYSESTHKCEKVTGEICSIGFNDDDCLYMTIKENGRIYDFVYNIDYENEVEVLVKNINFSQYEEKLKLEAEELTSNTERFYINVPFSEKDEAKELGAKWDPAIISWYYCGKENAHKFAKWEEIKLAKWEEIEEVSPEME